MMIQKEWQDEQDLFEAVYEALDNSSDFTAIARDEESLDGERGTMVIRTPDGRTFHLKLWEVK